MKTFTNINLTSERHTFNYLIEYYKDDLIRKTNYDYMIGDSVIIFGDEKFVKYNNEYINIDEYRSLYNIDSNTIEKDTYKLSKINIYFPDFSIDTYDNTLYTITANVWINGKKVVLVNDIINRIDCCANTKMFQKNGNIYNEYYSLELIDPYDVVYSDEWKEFRNVVCGEPIMDDGSNINNTGTQLCISITPVEYYEGKYIIKKGYDGGQNSLDIVDLDEKFKLNIFPGFDDNGYYIACKCDFNKEYDDISEYLKETYYINDVECRYELMCNYSKNGNILISKESTNEICRFERSELKTLDIFKNWVDEPEGITIIGSINIKINGVETLSFISNSIPVTHEMMKYLYMENPINLIDLNTIDMNIYNINAVNKNVVETIKVDNISDYKSHIIQPVFIRVRDSSNIIIHKGINENICINLDPYKSKVSRFIIKIGDNNFKQTSSTSQGIIFKINGALLKDVNESGTYYILNEDYELVTTGKYTCE